MHVSMRCLISSYAVCYRHSLAFTNFGVYYAVSCDAQILPKFHESTPVREIYVDPCFRICVFMAFIF